MASLLECTPKTTYNIDYSLLYIYGKPSPIVLNSVFV